MVAGVTVSKEKRDSQAEAVFFVCCMAWLQKSHSITLFRTVTGSRFQGRDTDAISAGERQSHRERTTWEGTNAGVTVFGGYSKARRAALKAESEGQA